MAESIEQLIRRIAQEVGVNPDLAVAMAKQESGLNPRAVGDNGDSVGLFQLNQRGMGAGMGDSRYDPETNARKSLTSLAAYVKAHPNETPGQQAAGSQRPFDAAGYARSVNAMLGGGQGQAHQGSTFNPASRVAGASTVAENPKRAEIQRQIKEAEADAKILAGTLEKAEVALEWGKLAPPARPSEREGASKATQKAVDDAKEAIAKNEAKVDKLRLDETNIKDPTEGVDPDKNPKGQVQNFGTAAKPDWRQYDAANDSWTPMANAPQGVPDKPTDPSLIGQREADAAATQARTEREAALLPGEINIQGANLRNINEQIAQRKLETQIAKEFQEKATAVLSMPPGPERDTALASLSQNAALTDPKSFTAYVQQQATQKINQWKQLEESTGQRHDPMTLQPALDAAGQPQLTESARAIREREAQTKAQADRDIARGEREERQGIATGVKGLLDLDQKRKTDYASAQAQYERSGIATPDRVANLQQMGQNRITPEQAAAAIGLDMNSPQFQAIWQHGQSFLSGQGGPEAQPQQPAQAVPVPQPQMQQPAPQPAPMPVQQPMPQEPMSGPMQVAAMTMPQQPMQMAPQAPQPMPAPEPPPEPAIYELVRQTLGREPYEHEVEQGRAGGPVAA